MATTSKAVKTSCKNTKVRSASGACVPERPTMKKGGSTPFGILSIIAGIDKNPKPTAADRIAGAKKGNKKMAEGGMTESCGPGKPGCGYAKAQRKNKRSASMSKVGPVVGKVLGTIATIGAGAIGAMKGKKMLEEQKVGGAVKKSLPKAQDGRITKTYQGPLTDAANKLLDKSYPSTAPVRVPNAPNKAELIRGFNPFVNGVEISNEERELQDRNMRENSMRKPSYRGFQKTGGITKAKVGGTKHPGFKVVQSKIAAKQGISKQAAGAILASSTRKASAKAKAKNPRLKKVK
jgi:hypothetical protein